MNYYHGYVKPRASIRIEPWVCASCQQRSPYRMCYNPKCKRSLCALSMPDPRRPELPVIDTEGHGA